MQLYNTSKLSIEGSFDGGSSWVKLGEVAQLDFPGRFAEIPLDTTQPAVSRVRIRAERDGTPGSIRLMSEASFFE
jgi:hypothetical protein